MSDNENEAYTAAAMAPKMSEIHPHTGGDVSWPKGSSAWKEVAKQHPMLQAVCLVGAILFTNAVFGAIEYNGKRILTLRDYMIMEIVLATVVTLMFVVTIWWSMFGIKTAAGKQIFDPKHFTSFKKFMTFAMFGTWMSLGLLLTTYNLAPAASIDEWNDFSVSRYGAVTASLQRFITNMDGVWMVNIVVAVVGVIPAADVFDAWWFPLVNAQLGSK